MSNEILYNINDEETASLEAELIKKFDGTKWILKDAEQQFVDIVGFFKEAHGPCGRKVRKVFLFNKERIRMAIEANIQNYKYLPRYEGVYSENSQSAEIQIITTNDVTGRGDVWYKLMGVSRYGDDGEKRKNLKLVYTLGRHEIEISSKSVHFGILMNCQSEETITVKVSGIRHKSTDEVTDLIEKITNSLFVELDIARSSGVILAKRYGSHGLDRNSQEVSDFKPSFKNEYQKAVIDLYWQARISHRMPLFQYLSYYQILEYYYPKYIQISTRNRIVNILKRPGFSPFDDDCIDQVMASLGKSGRSVYDEKNQLRNVLMHCCDPGRVRKILDNDSDLADDLLAKDGIGPRLNTVDDDKLIESISDRIYHIRCRIVHSKNDGTDSPQKPLLPFSEEVIELLSDIRFIEDLAQQVIISNAKSLQIS